MTRKLEYMPLGQLEAATKNPKRHALAALARSVNRFGYVEPVVVDERTGRLVAGHGRVEHLRAAQEAGEEPPDGVEVKKGVWCVPVVRGWQSASDAEADAYLVASNRLTEMGGWDSDELGALLKGMDEALALAAGFSAVDLKRLLGGNDRKDKARLTLAERFVVPPFSILDARQGYWQDRKRAWLDLGIQSEIGRDANLLQMSDTVLAAQAPANRDLGEQYEGGDAWGNAGTSIFDPVICELAYRWWAPAGGRILDPFAGGSARGVVAGTLGCAYRGIDLSARQVEANEAQLATIEPAADVKWIVGDAKEVLADQAWEPYAFDALLTCPPYFDLERYSDDPADLSNAASYDEFRSAFGEIMRLAIERLRHDSFAVVVVGEIRGDQGWCRGFVPDTIHAVQAAGAMFYNDCVLLTAVGSLALRAARIFGGARKVGKAHQNVLVFVKGDPKKAAERASEFTPTDLASLFGEVADVPG